MQICLTFNHGNQEYNSGGDYNACLLIHLLVYSLIQPVCSLGRCVVNITVEKLCHINTVSCYLIVAFDF